MFFQVMYLLGEYEPGKLAVVTRMMAVAILTSFYIVISFILKSGGSNPVPVNPRTTLAVEGSNVTLYCTVVKNSSEPVSWTSSHSLSLVSRGNRILREGLVSTSQYDRLSISGNSDLGEYNLNFQNVQAEDAGQYSCGYFSVSQRAAIFSPRASLSVILPPLCEYFHGNFELTPGIQIQMVCTSKNNRPYTDLTWLRNGQVLRGMPSSQTERSNTINYMLTEDDYDQPFTCIESMSPLSYVPHCFITPLRQTRKPVHVSSQEVVTVGGITHFTCLTNQSLESFSYQWFVDSLLTSSVTNMYSFGPVGSDDNGTRVTCEVHRDGTLYGRDEIVIIVTPAHEATYKPVSYVPYCSITPQIRRPVYIANSPEVVTAGGVSHLSCSVNELIDCLSYRWYLHSNLVHSSGSTFNFGPVTLNDNGTNITCEILQDGNIYGKNSIVVIVTPLPPKTCEKAVSGSKKQTTAMLVWGILFLLVFFYLQ